MTKLETDIYNAITSNLYAETAADMTDVEKDGIAKAAAGAVILWLRTAFQDGQASVNTKYGEFDQNFEEWANENGIL